MDYLLNEDSWFCCLPKSFMDHHINLLDNDKVSNEDIQKAKDLLQKADAQALTTIDTTGQNQNILQQGPNILPPLIPQNRNTITPFPPINSM